LIDRDGVLLNLHSAVINSTCNTYKFRCDRGILVLKQMTVLRLYNLIFWRLFKGEEAILILRSNVKI